MVSVDDWRLQAAWSVRRARAVLVSDVIDRAADFLQQPPASEVAEYIVDACGGIENAIEALNAALMGDAGVGRSLVQWQFRHAVRGTLESMPGAPVPDRQAGPLD